MENKLIFVVAHISCTDGVDDNRIELFSTIDKARTYMKTLIAANKDAYDEYFGEDNYAVTEDADYMLFSVDEQNFDEIYILQKTIDNK
jgi:hypothetical protein